MGVCVGCCAQLLFAVAQNAHAFHILLRSQLQRTQWRTIPSCQRHAVYASAIACLADWVTTFADGNVDDGKQKTSGKDTHTVVQDVCRLCYQWATQGMQSLVPIVQADASTEVVQALESTTSSSSSTPRMPLTAEVVAPMCLALTRILPHNPPLVLGVLELYPACCT